MSVYTEGTDSCRYNAIAIILEGVIPALVTLGTQVVFFLAQISAAIQSNCS